MSTLRSMLTGLLCSTAMLSTECLALDRTPDSAAVIEFGGAGTLFLADEIKGKVFAYELKNVPNETDKPQPKAYNVTGFGTKLADVFKTTVGHITYNDLAVHPVTKEAYIALSIRTMRGQKPAIVRVSVDGQISKVDLTKLDHTSIDLAKPANDKVKFWRDVPASTLTVTDLDYADGTLYIAGLSTGEFASTLRQTPYPFKGDVAASSIEIYHAAHNQNETRAPIRAMTVMDIDGEKSLVAAYTCTPLVTLPVASLKDGKHVVGKTIAELGYGNTPLEVLSFSAYNMEQKPEQFVLVINREMDADIIAMNDLIAATKAPGLKTPIEFLGATKGVKTTPLPLSGVIQAADQDAQFLLTLRRNLDTGEMELVSFRKGAYFRLSDFISEYNFPDYKYPKDQDGTRQFQNMLKADEDYADQVR